MVAVGRGKDTTNITFRPSYSPSEASSGVGTMDASLYLEDGTHLHGEGLGACGETAGEFVFNTCHTGYEEVLTDPSYAGQIVVFTASHIGNTGITDDDHESRAMFAGGMICKELSRISDNHRSRRDLREFLKAQGKTALHGIDTRFLAQKLRDKGSMMGIISCTDHDPESLAKKLKGVHSPSEMNVVAQASTRETYTRNANEPGQKVAVLDFGIKKGILDCLTAAGMTCTVFPWDTPASKIHEMRPDGVFLSNGPGDPRYLAKHTTVIEELQKLIPHYPTFGICLGHQLIGLAMGGDIEKLPFGHHAANHPVKELFRDEKTSSDAPVQITSQNHNYAIVGESVSKRFDITHLHLNDGSVAGMRHKHLPILSVQFHPESNPGPHDSRSLFRQFNRLMEARTCLAAAM